MLSSSSEYKFDAKKYTVSQMLDDAAAQIGNRWSNDPLTEATVRQNLGESYQRLNRLPEARNQFTRALQLFRSIGDEPDIAKMMFEMASQSDMEGKFEDAIVGYRETLALLNRLGPRADPPTLFMTKMDLAWEFVWLKRDLGEAGTLLAEAIALGRREPGIRRTWVSEAQTHKAELLQTQGKEAEAKAMLEESLRVGRQEAPGGFWERVPLFDLSAIEVERGNFQTAADEARRVFELDRKFKGEKDPYTAQSEIRWALLRAQAGGSVEDALREVMAAMPTLRQGFPAGSPYLRMPFSNTAQLLVLAKRFKEAESYAREALANADTNHVALDSEKRATSLEWLGMALNGQKRYGEAAAALVQSEAIFQKTPNGGRNLPGLRAALNEARQMAALP